MMKDLKATPELEDFGHKYTEEGQGKIGSALLNKYFKSVEDLLGYFLRDGKSDVTLRAIEIGCGEGYSTQRLRKMLPENVTLDASEYVEQLVPKAQELNPSVTVTQESIYELQHEDESYDIIFLLEVMEHLDYPEDALKEIKRVLKKDGVLILGVPREPLWRGLNMARGKYVKDFGNTVGHLNHWSSGGLVKFMEKHFGRVLASRKPLPWTLVLVRKDDQ